MSAKSTILGRLRAALADAPIAPMIPRDYRRVGTADADTVRSLLVDRLVDYRAFVTEVASADLAVAVAARVGDTGTVVHPDGLPATWLAEIDSGRLLSDSPGAPLAITDLDASAVVVTAAAVAIAETGTIVLDGGADQGRRVISLVPDHHVCIVPASSIVELVPEGLGRVDLTRPVTLVSGPSATSDIELERVEGVHGPRALDVLLVVDA